MKNIRSSNELRSLLQSIDHKGYPAYKGLAGSWKFADYLLVIDHVQGDPFASPSSLHVEIDNSKAGFPAVYFEKECSCIALRDFLTRQLYTQFERFNFKAKGSGKSGLLSITRCGQEVLCRSACELKGQKWILRFHVGFPAFGRSINAGELQKILFDFLPKCIESSLFFSKLNKQEVERAVFLSEDQEEIRRILKKEGLVCFVANGSILPRKSGVSSRPLPEGVAFCSPVSMEKTIKLPHHGEIKGMAVKKGVTLIVGGGYHGKSTLLEAIQAGVYDHIEGDGREFVITDDTAVKLRAEDGRSIRDVDISLFINDLPNKKDTTSFTTQDASGSTSQAAAVIEGMEAGSRLFLVDEDTSATNFMVRDEFMQQVISKDKEPITPFIERIRDLYEKAGISTIMVAGSSGEFFHIADSVILMDCYRAVDITQKVKELCKEKKTIIREAQPFIMPGLERVYPSYKRTGKDNRYEHMKVKSYGLDSISLDKEIVNVHYLEQLTDAEQTQCLGLLLRLLLEQIIDGRKTVQQAVQTVYDRLLKEGFDTISPSYVPCGLARPRIQELFACLNRFRGGM